MLCGIYGIKGVLFVNVLCQSHVECAPSNIGLHSVDGCMGLWVTEQDQVRRNADSLAIDLE